MSSSSRTPTPSAGPSMVSLPRPVPPLRGGGGSGSDLRTQGAVRVPGDTDPVHESSCSLSFCPSSFSVRSFHGRLGPSRPSFLGSPRLCPRGRREGPFLGPQTFTHGESPFCTFRQGQLCKGLTRVTLLTSPRGSPCLGCLRVRGRPSSAARAHRRLLPRVAPAAGTWLPPLTHPTPTSSIMSASTHLFCRPVSGSHFSLCFVPVSIYSVLLSPLIFSTVPSLTGLTPRRSRILGGCGSHLGGSTRPVSAGRSVPAGVCSVEFTSPVGGTVRTECPPVGPVLLSLPCALRQCPSGVRLSYQRTPVRQGFERHLSEGGSDPSPDGGETWGVLLVSSSSE